SAQTAGRVLRRRPRPGAVRGREGDERGHGGRWSGPLRPGCDPGLDRRFQLADDRGARGARSGAGHAAGAEAGAEEASVRRGEGEEAPAPGAAPQAALARAPADPYPSAVAKRRRESVRIVVDVHEDRSGIASVLTDEL